MTQTIESELTWTGEAFESGIQIRVRDDGRIDAVGRLGDEPSLRLDGEALIPGFVDAHSHSTLRGMRGAGERYDRRADDSARWSQDVLDYCATLDPDRIRLEAAVAFGEMRSVGITTVGEFVDRGLWGDSADDVARAILAAASEIGIRIVLLQSPHPSESDVNAQDRFWESIDALESELAPRQSLGVAIGDVGAWDIGAIDALYTTATGRGLPFHAEIEWTAEEIERHRRSGEKGSLARLNEHLEIMSNFTAVHCTHSEPRELDRFLDRGANLCITPMTDAALGRGIQRRLPLVQDRLSIGTGLNLRISFIEELRWLEYSHRLDARARGVFRDAAGRVAPSLLEIGTIGGARALGAPAARIAPGHAADFATIDLTHRQLADIENDRRLEAALFGCGDEIIRRTATDGIWRVHGV